MITIIVESGSTKSDWVLLENDKRTYLSTMGFNPYFHDEATIKNAILKQHILPEKAEEVAEIFFYGAGCSTPELNAIVKNAFSEVFPKSSIHVNHDLEACAFSCYQGEPLIACILGTGSNSCFFNGKEVSEEIPSLAYVLGDEGSGSYYGKQLLSKFLYKQLPPEIHADFYEQYQLDKDEIISNVYFKPNPNVYIASFASFLGRHADHPFVVDMVREGMHRFLSTHVLCYQQAKSVKIHFVGSIAHHFQHILRDVGKTMGLQIGQVLRKPIDGLISYHQNYYQRATI